MRWIALIVLLLFLTACSKAAPIAKENQPIIAPGSATPTLPPQIVEVKVTASNFQFEPSQIKVRQGDTVRLTLTSKDAAHGIIINGYDATVEAAAGETKSVEFVADRAGVYEFQCSVYCGSGHRAMRGQLIVE